MRHPARAAVLASGGGSNLQALIDHFHSRADPAARVELVVGNRAGIGALARAEAAGVPHLVLDARTLGAQEHSRELISALERFAVDLVVLAGYLQLVPAAVVERFAGRMLNIHPALLPAFGGPGMYGLRVHRAVLASGARVSGASVHLVDTDYDSGRIIAQWPVPVWPGDTPEELAARVLEVEHRLLPAAVEALVTGATAARPGGPLAFDLVPAGTPPGSIRALVVPDVPSLPTEHR